MVFTDLIDVIGACISFPGNVLKWLLLLELIFYWAHRKETKQRAARVDLALREVYTRRVGVGGEQEAKDAKESLLRDQRRRGAHTCVAHWTFPPLCRKQVELFHMMVFVMLFGPRPRERNQARKWSSLGVNKFCLYLPHNENIIYLQSINPQRAANPSKNAALCQKKTRHLMHMSAAVCSMSWASFFKVHSFRRHAKRFFRKRIKTRGTVKAKHGVFEHFLITLIRFHCSKRDFRF